MNLIAENLSYFGDLGVPLDEHVEGNQLTCVESPLERASVTREEGRILAALVAGRNVLEIGTGLGVSALCMNALARRVVSVDNDPWVAENIKTPRSVIRLSSVGEAQIHGPYDVVFIDGSHEYKDVCRDIRDALFFLGGRGVLVFHDFSQKSVRMAVEEHSQFFSKWATLPTCGQLTIGVIP